MSTQSFAEKELRAIGYNPETDAGPNKWMYDAVMELLAVFSKQGHSGFSAGECIHLFTTLASHKPLSPLTGADDEWMDIDGNGLFQNTRCSRVFKQNGQAYDIDGRVFVDTKGIAYTNKDSRVNVTFPYTPKTEYCYEMGEPNPNEA